MKDGKLFVALMDTSDKKQAFARDYNNSVMASVKDKWTYCKYEFVTTQDAIDLREKNPDAYVMIPTETETINYGARPFTNDVYQSVVCNISIGRADHLIVKKKLIGKNYSVIFKKVVLTAMKGSFEYISVLSAIKDMNDRAFYVTSSKEEKDAYIAKLKGANVILRTKTLLLDKALLDKDMTEAEIKKIYNYPFKISDGYEIENAVRTKDANMAFIQIEPLSREKNLDALFVKTCSDMEYTVVIGFKRGRAVGEKKIAEINELTSRDKKKK